MICTWCKKAGQAMSSLRDRDGVVSPENRTVIGAMHDNCRGCYCQHRTDKTHLTIGSVDV